MTFFVIILLIILVIYSLPKYIKPKIIHNITTQEEREYIKNKAKFDINNRTKFDAAISSGLAIMACNRNLYTPKQERQTKVLNFGFRKYNNQGSISKIIE